MTIDEKIKQAAEKHNEVDYLKFTFSKIRQLLNKAHLEIVKRREYRGARESDVLEWLSEYVENNFTHKSVVEAVKSEMLADMQKLVDALEFYADESSWSISETYKQFNRIDDQDLEYKPGCGRYDLLAGKKAREALGEFNAKYKDIANGKNN